MTSFLSYFIKPIPKEAKTFCDYPKCKNRGWWNVQNGNAIYCDKHLCKWIKDNEGNYLIVNRSLKTLLKEIKK